MSKICTNIKERVLLFAENQEVSKQEFFRKTGLKYSNFTGKSKESDLQSSYIVEILLKYPDLNIEWLLTGEGDMLKKAEVNFVEPSEVYKKKTKSILPKVITVDSHNEDNIVLVPVKASAGYLSGYGDPDFIQTLPTYRLPNLNNGTFRMFQVNGDSMYPTIHDKSYVVGQWIENPVEDIKDDRIYVVVSKEQGVVVKRVLNRLEKYGNLYCKSDNRKEYPSFSVESSDIIEVWEVKLYIGIDLPNPATMYDRINDVEAEIMHLKQLLKKG